jgi:protoheme ferro-lyase
MKAATKNIKSSNNTYNPALDHLIGKELCKDKVDAARAFLKEHGLPKRFYEKSDS